MKKTPLLMILFALAALPMAAMEVLQFPDAHSIESFPIWQGKFRLSRDYAPGVAPDSALPGSVKFTADVPGQRDWDIQVVFPSSGGIVSGQRYELRLRLMSPQKLQFPIMVMQDFDPWAKLGADASATVETRPGKWQTVALSFIADKDCDRGIRTPVFYLGTLPKGSVLYVAEMLFCDPDELPEPPADEAEDEDEEDVGDDGKAHATFTVKDEFAVEGLSAKKDWSYSAAWKQSFGQREKVSLCGMWDFAPARGVKEPLPAADAENWANFIVPGYWRGGNLTNFVHTGDGKTVTAYRGVPLEKIRCAWYRRTIDIPSAWEGRKVMLRFNQINHDAEILVNGQRAGGTSDFTVFPVYWDDAMRACDLDISQLIRYGQQNELAVRVSTASGLDERRSGIAGYVYLETAPMESFGSPAVSTQVSRGTMRIDFKGNTVHGGRLSVTIRDWKTGETVYKQEMPFDESIQLDCLPPKLWSPDSPNLYWCELALERDGVTIDEAQVRFGACEVTVNGGDYFLNGSKFDLYADTALDPNNYWTSNWRTNADYIRKEARAMRAMNLNAVYFSGMMPKELLDVYDEEGILAIAHIAFNYDTHLKDSDQKMLSRFRRQIATIKGMDRFDNHPSHIGFLFDVWFNFHPGTTNPEYIGLKADAASHPAFDRNGDIVTRTGGDPNIAGGDRGARQRRFREIAALLKENFPGKLMLTGASGEAGDAFSTHCYHTWGAPFEELRALFGRYALQREQPVFIGEFNIPYPGSLCPLDVFNPHEARPLALENFARYSGNRGYRWRPFHCRRLLQDLGNDSLMGSRMDRLGDLQFWIPSDLYSALLTRTNETIVPGWRFSGVTGIGFFGFVQSYHLLLAGCSRQNLDRPLPDNLSAPAYTPEHMAYGAYLPPFDCLGEGLFLKPTLSMASHLRVTAPVLAEFMEPGKDPYALDHAWFGGETLKKQLVVINDSPEEKSLVFRITLRNGDNRALRSVERACTIAAGGRSELPVEFELPFTATRVDGRLSAESIGQDPQVTASLDIQWFPEAPPLKTRRTIYLFDPDGGVKRYLSAQKTPFTQLPSLAALPAGPGILLVGRKALSSAHDIPDFNQLADNGMNTLILEQQLASSAELMQTRTRHAFINAAAHPALAGFRDPDFANWRGGISLADAYEHNPPGYGWAAAGNRNMLASHVFRRPSHGNYRALLCSGFDLYQTPLLEYCGQGGSWIASQLELVPRLGVDPVATTLFHRLVSYLDQLGAAEGEVLFFGGKKGMALLDKMQVAYTPTALLDAQSLENARVVLISDPDFGVLRDQAIALTRFVYRGGQLFYIHAGDQFESTWLPFPLKLKKVTARQALHSVDRPDSFWRCGWDDNDLYWHDEFTLPAFDDIPEQANAFSPGVVVDLPHGAGRFTLISITPELFGDTPACGKTCRLLCAILSGAGVVIRNDGAAFAVRAGESHNLDLADFNWSFALDPDDIGLSEKVETGENGTLEWQSGLVGDGAEVKLGVAFEQFLRREYDGHVWYRLKFPLPPELENLQKCYLSIGAIDDFDWAYVNGKLVGHTGRETPSWWQAPRLYEIPGGLLKPGENVIAIRVLDEKGEGGIMLPMVLGSQPVVKGKSNGWQTPYPNGSSRDYHLNPDIVRQY